MSKQQERANERARGREWEKIVDSIPNWNFGFFGLEARVRRWASERASGRERERETKREKTNVCIGFYFGKIYKYIGMRCWMFMVGPLSANTHKHTPQKRVHAQNTVHTHMVCLWAMPDRIKWNAHLSPKSERAHNLYNIISVYLYLIYHPFISCFLIIFSSLSRSLYHSLGIFLSLGFNSFSYCYRCWPVVFYLIVGIYV